MKGKNTTTIQTNYLKFVNCLVLESYFTEQNDLLYDGEVTVDKEKGIIIDIERKDKDAQPVQDCGTSDSRKLEIIDCGGNILAPGYIDIQCKLITKLVINMKVFIISFLHDLIHDIVINALL